MTTDTRFDLPAYRDGLSIEEVIGLAEKLGPAERDGAVELYKRWIGANPYHPQGASAWFNLGVELSTIGKLDDAQNAYRSALRLQPTLYQASVNLGLLYERSGSTAQAIQTWQEALQPDTARVTLLNQIARQLETSGQLIAAETMLTISLNTTAMQPDALQHWIHLRQQMCRWPAIPDAAFGLDHGALFSFASPLAVLALTDDIAIQTQFTAGWLGRLSPNVECSRLSPARPYHHDRIRVGYLSSDFGQHAMGYLIADLFQYHDRSEFEIYGLCIGKGDGSELRERILASFDHVVLLDGLSDEAAARRIASDEIDVLIDLNGVTRGARLEILRWRPAPIQATYLGFIGPVPVPELDYMLCDDYVIPPDLAQQYSPKPLPIGPLYQANDTHRIIADTMVSRDVLGLPSDAFVYCNFSNHYKITEAMFNAWVDILLRVPNAVLWLAHDNEWSRLNLINIATKRGISASRLIFCERTAPADYMARFRSADLYLDTFPYNSGTVASDSLRMELPLLTLQGQAFASRMAARLLHAIDAHLGIAETMSGYVETAVLLATRQEIYRHYKSIFTFESWKRTLGNMKSFTETFESTLKGLIYDAHFLPLAPAPMPKNHGSG